MSIRTSLTTAALLFAATPAFATWSPSELATAQQILSQYNLVNFGDYHANNETEGAIVVGGNFIANGAHNAGVNGNAATPTVNGQTFGEVTVYGNLSGGVSPGANAYIQGTASGTIELSHHGSLYVEGSAAGAAVSDANQIYTSQSTFAGTHQNTGNGNVFTNQPASTVFPFASFASTFQTPLTDLANALGQLPGTAGVTAQALPGNMNNYSLTANSDFTSGGKSYGVITTTLANLASDTNFVGINNGSNAATIVVVTANGSTAVLPTLNGNIDESKVIWDFVDANTLNFGGQWFGTVLAPYATFSTTSNLTGPVIANSLTQGGELHLNNSYLFKGDLSGLPTTTPTATVPEPTSIALLGTGLLGLLLARRRSA